MANTYWQDKGSTEILSSHISGLQDAVKNIEQSLDMDTEVVSGYPLVLIPDADDNYRIAEAKGKRNWLNSPAPVVQQNIEDSWTTITDGFSIDYAGGAIIFDGDKTGEQFRASFTRVKNTSEFNTHKAEEATQTKLGHIKLADIPSPTIATQAEAEAGTNNTKMMTPLRVAQAIDKRIPILSTWQEAQQIVRQGKANEYFSVGDQLVSAYDGGEITWVVIGIDVETPADSNFNRSLTLQTLNCLHDMQFDAPEPTNPNSDRKNYGNNRYIHSAVRQWLNSNEPIFQWVSQHQYDAPPTGSLDIYNGPGFLYRLDPELVAVLGKVNKKVARNTVTDDGGQDTFSDKVFLLSRLEVDLGTEGTTTGEFVYPYYDGIGNAGRIKTLSGSARVWWLRSPNVSSSHNVCYVSTGGSLSINNANAARGVAPACVII